MPLKNFTQEKMTQTSGAMTQTSGANSEHKHSKIERFSTLNEGTTTQQSKLKRLHQYQVSVSSVTCTNQSL